MEPTVIDSIKSEVEEKATAKLSPEYEKPDEPDTDSTTVKAVVQGHEEAPDSEVTETTPQLSESMETSMPELEDQHPQYQSETVKNSPASHENVPNSSTTQITPKLSEAVETKVSEQKDLSSGCQSETVEKDTLSPVSGGGGSLTLLSVQYRDDSSEDLSDSDSDSSSSTSSSSSSSSGPTVSIINEVDQDEDEDGVAPGKRPPPVKTQDELLIQDLPAVENLCISLPEEAAIEPAGIISSIVDQLVIVESNKDISPLNEDSVLFSKNRLSIGKVFEVFGPVCQPYYILRFNSQEDIEQRELKIRDPVFFAPQIKDFTDHIFVEQIKQCSKGSDASWRNDQEPPPEALDFSDDEEERLAKQKLKQQKRQQLKNQEDSDSDSESSACKPPSQKPPRRKPRQNWGSARGRAAHHSGFHTNYHANSHFQSDFPLPLPGPFHLPFQGYGFTPYPRPPPPHMGIGPWHPGPYPGPMFYPPPPPPPPPPSN